MNYPADLPLPDIVLHGSVLFLVISVLLRLTLRRSLGEIDTFNEEAR
jgi:hypothetical protein